MSRRVKRRLLIGKDRDFLLLRSLVLKSQDDGSLVAPLIQKGSLPTSKPPNPQKGLQRSGPSSAVPNRPKPMATRTSSSNTTPAQYTPTTELFLGLFPGDDELIAKNKARATSKPTNRPPSSNTTIPDSQPLMTPTPQSTAVASGLAHDTKALLDGQRADIDRVIASIEEQRADINRIIANVDSLTQDMKSAKASMDYLKFQQKTFAEHETTPSPSALAEDLHILTRETKVLSEGVTHIRAKTGQFDSFTRELDSLKERIQHLEDATVFRERTANGSVEAAVSASRQEEQGESNSYARLEPIHVSNSALEDPSPTLLGALSAQASASRRTSTYSLPLDIFVNGHVRESRISTDKDMTPESEPFGGVKPQITSAEKVAAHNRRRLSDSSSDAQPPLKRRGRQSKDNRTPDWTTKLMSLNDHNNVLTSDPEDDDYDPDKRTQDLAEVLANERRGKGPIRMPTPEWEKPDWEGPILAPPANSTRGKSTSRRGVSGRGPLIDRDTLRRRSSGLGNEDYVYADSPQYWADQRPQGPQEVSDLYEKPRDSQGRLIRQNGKVDGRSMRHQRAREEKERQAAVQRRLQQTTMSQASSKVTQSQLKEMQAMGLQARGTGQSFVDAAALQAAGYTPVSAGPSTPAAGGLSFQSPFGPDGSNEHDATSINGGIGGPSATMGAVAPGPKNDKHAGLMKKVFPWR
ncbi:MAG: hypothetical protein Q9224_004429 [Gallowayella concinna]